MTLICPKCHGTMRSYERNGVTIEQCAECRGIFLDRGELEHLVAAEALYNTASAPQPVPPAGARLPSYDDRRGPGAEDPRYGDQRYPDPRYPDPRYAGPRYADPRRAGFEDPGRVDRRFSDDDHYRGKPKKRKKSFLEEFFD
jgi:Zn-finger nucleic acid-binding protein